MANPRPDQLQTGNKYEIVAESVATCGGGSLLDVGSRDRILERALEKLSAGVSYVAADVRAPADLVVDLEKGLGVARESFDYVVALDVLEHVDAFHEALVGLLAASKRRCYVALPNMAALPHRLSFLRHGKLGTDKYDLRTTRSPDRHRWLCVMPAIMDVVCAIMEREGFEVRETYRLAIGVRGLGHLLRIRRLARLLSNGPLVDRVLVVGERRVARLSTGAES